MQEGDTALTSRRYRVRMTTMLPQETPHVTTPTGLMTAEELLVYEMPGKRVER
jgi:hypothetical protein